MKEIVIIGSGNLAESLAVAVAAAPELRLVQLFARNEARGREVAALAGTVWCGDAAQLARAELYLIAVSDRAGRSRRGPHGRLRAARCAAV